MCVLVLRKERLTRSAPMLFRHVACDLGHSAAVPSQCPIDLPLSSMPQWSARLSSSPDGEPQALQQLLNYGSSRLRAAMAAWNEYIDVDEESILGLERLTQESQAWWARNIGNETVSAP